jgi:hypothetical protein
MTFHTTKANVPNRGVAPDSFLTELVNWGKTAPEEIFAARPSPQGKPDPDIYVQLNPELGPWSSPQHRRAAMLECLRVLAGFESSWNWTEGVDMTNAHSLAHIEGQETGAFQVSFDSVAFSPELAECVNRYCGGVTAGLFIPAMKANHNFAMEYVARLLRHSWKWDGPIRRGELQNALNRDSCAEFQSLLVSP